jgi:hypothetical protein
LANGKFGPELTVDSMEIELSIIMPCLNEAETLEKSITKAQQFFERAEVFRRGRHRPLHREPDPVRHRPYAVSLSGARFPLRLARFFQGCVPEDGYADHRNEIRVRDGH